MEVGASASAVGGPGATVGGEEEQYGGRRGPRAPQASVGSRDGPFGPAFGHKRAGLYHSGAQGCLYHSGAAGLSVPFRCSWATCTTQMQQGCLHHSGAVGQAGIGAGRQGMCRRQG